MPESSGSNLPGLLSRYQDRILTDWIAAQSEVGVLRADLMREAELRRQSRSFLNHLIAYFAVMVVLVPVNAVLDPGRAWFVLPLVGWGAPLAVHAAYAMGLIGRKRAGGDA